MADAAAGGYASFTACRVKLSGTAGALGGQAQ
jgi:hypothetical protein